MIQATPKFKGGTRHGTVLAMWTLVAALAACGEPPQPIRVGAELRQPLHPRFTLTDTDGQPFDFAAETEGFMTLLFFGYTYCPDVCPVHMANIAGTLEKLPHRITSQVKVVFVTTDPERDTPARIREWLDNFDTGFIGLRGSDEQIADASRQLKMPPPIKGPETDGTYEVGHSARVVAFTRDGAGRFLYPFGTRQNDWATEIVALVQWQPE
jgi:protein SCO1/2